MMTSNNSHFATNVTEDCEVFKNVYDGHYFQFEFEKNFDYCSWTPVINHFFSNYIHYVVAIYIITIFGIKHLMRERRAFELKYPLFLWNLSLAIFSIIGTLRVVPELVFKYNTLGLMGSYCDQTGTRGVSGFWFFLFCISKIPEMIDTLFIVLRKKPLVFIHYFHHLETATVSFFIYSSSLGVFRWFATMNFAIHSVMYSYYALSAIGRRPSNKIAMFITLSQVTQMFVGTYVTVMALANNNDTTCRGNLVTLRAALATYAIYAVLFTDYFVKSYFGKKSRKPLNATILEQNNNVVKKTA